MVSIQEARRIADQYMEGIDSHIEEPQAYIFRVANPSPDEMEDNEVVVLKKDGRVISYMQYIMEVK